MSDAMGEQLLLVKNLTKDFGGLRACDNVTFSLGTGDLVGLVGPNGAGKTTCFNLITGFLKPTSGNLIYKGMEISRLSSHQIVRAGIARTFQITSLFFELTVLENVMVGLHRNIEGSFFSALNHGTLGIGSATSKEHQQISRATKILEFWGLAAKTYGLAKNIALPDQKRLAIAIATATEPKLLLLDEPASGMRAKELNDLADHIKYLRNQGITILLVEHNMSFVMNLCERIIVLDHGAKIAEGTPPEVRNNDEVIRVYLGRRRV